MSGHGHCPVIEGRKNRRLAEQLLDRLFAGTFAPPALLCRPRRVGVKGPAREYSLARLPRLTHVGLDVTAPAFTGEVG